MRACILFAVVLLCASQVSAQAIVDFEDLTVGARYFVGQQFQTNGVTVGVEALSSTYGGGSCAIGNNGHAGGSGNEAWTGNVLLRFDFGSISQLSLLFGNYGGYTKVEVNGDLRQVTNLLDLNGIQIGGANASVTQSAPAGNVYGSLNLTGPISSFAIGGQEFAFDSVAAVPEPSSVLSLFIGCCSVISVGRIRRRGI